MGKLIRFPKSKMIEKKQERKEDPMAAKRKRRKRRFLAAAAACAVALGVFHAQKCVPDDSYPISPEPIVHEHIPQESVCPPDVTESAPARGLRARIISNLGSKAGSLRAAVGARSDEVVIVRVRLGITGSGAVAEQSISAICGAEPCEIPPDLSGSGGLDVEGYAIPSPGEACWYNILYRLPER